MITKRLWCIRGIHDTIVFGALAEITQLNKMEHALCLSEGSRWCEDQEVLDENKLLFRLQITITSEHTVRSKTIYPVFFYEMRKCVDTLFLPDKTPIALQEALAELSSQDIGESITIGNIEANLTIQPIGPAAWHIL
jgi:hypothetical protein